ncbi:Proton-dependent oligopeptide transporter family [Macleaya cordata]|uniref:Proton-dependent oligopeptide transporter family n=1 Tax=Macleaya cordata TaxID=56857 RepID=A0A200Q2B7_MACCD|nr:Proton-dependent oligopeptide transporter family [Macleaya cordata]
MAVQGMVDWKRKPVNKDKHGGNRAAGFIYFMVVMTNVTYVSNVLNMVLYLRRTMHLDVATSSTTVTNFIGASCAFALIGGFVSDSYITRFTAIMILGPFEFLGFGLLALQAHLPSLQPPVCDISAQFSNCKQVHSYNAALLYIGLYLTAFGEGCLRANLAPLGGDQFDDNDPTELRQKSSFFNWFTFSISLGAIVGLTLIVWIQDNKGWDLGFTVSAGFILLGVLVVGSGFPFFRHQIPTGSPLTRMLQVLVAAFRKRKLQFPENDEEMYLEYNKDEMVGEVLPHTKGFKWLDKASISDGKTGNWYICTVSQVEEMKIVLRMLPIFISAMIGYIPIPQLLTFTVQQGGTMNTKLAKLNVPPASLLIIPVILQLVILVAYDRLFVPLARRITGCPTGITHLQRVGVGFIASSLATCIGAVIEKKRKSVAEEHGLLDSGNQVPMSVMWLALQFLAIGIVDVSTFTGLLEFFNTEASKGMKSLGTAIFWCNLGLASLMGSLLVDVVNKATSHGRIGWLEGNNLNRNHLDRFYWLLTVLGLVAFLNYLYWARRYKYRQHNLASTS